MRVIASAAVLEGESSGWRQRVVWAGALFFLAALAIGCAGVARVAFFSDDDFRWLSEVRAPGFSLWASYFPFSERSWWAYRPLGMQSYFHAAQAVFGLWPPAFYAISLSLHFVGGVLIHRLCRALGFTPGVATAAALLALSRPPSMEVVFWASAFNYFGVAFFSLLSLALLAECPARGGAVQRAFSSAALGAALLCQESALALPPVLLALRVFQQRDGAHGSWVAHGVAGLRYIGPQIAVASLYALHRFVLIAPYPRHANYRAVWGRNVFDNSLQYVEWVAGGWGGAAFMALLVLGTPLLLLGWGQTRAIALRWLRAIALRWLLPLNGVLLLWLLGTLLPFATVRATAPRFAVAAEIPLCLLAGASLSALWRALPARRRPLLAAGIALLVIASFPFEALTSGRLKPRGRLAKPLFHWVVSQIDPLEPGTNLIVLYGGAGLLSDAWAVRRQVWTGSPLVRAIAPGRDLAMRFQDMEREAPKMNFAPRCRYVALGGDGKMHWADETLREDFFRRGLASAAPERAGAAAQRLVGLLGRAAVPSVVSAAEQRLGNAREQIAQALLLLDDPTAAKAVARLIPQPARRSELRRTLERNAQLLQRPVRPPGGSGQ